MVVSDGEGGGYCERGWWREALLWELWLSVGEMSGGRIMVQ